MTRSNLEKIANYLIPCSYKYNIEEEAKILEKETDKPFKICKRAIVRSYDENKSFLTYAKLADTSDKVTSLVGLGVESISSLFGVTGFLTNIGEESLEMIFKIPFLAKAYVENDTRSDAYGLMIREAITFGVPIGGDLYDIATNIYMTKAKEIIRERVKRELS